jgi:hypothetical protein
MNVQTLIRTSAIIYADEINAKTTNTIRRKFIESVFVCNNNTPINKDSLIDEIENSFKLAFSSDEITNIINKEDVFEINQIKQTISLSNKRYIYLKNKETLNINQSICEFIPTLSSAITVEQMNAIVEKYLYYLLNTNIQLYSYILKPDSVALKHISIDNKQFSAEEVNVINEFLLWDNHKKNELLFKLVSFCIEYSLVINNSNDNIFLNALRNKVFYLDNNVIYRAIGINGDIRKRRTEVFLQKCVHNGQELLVSRFSKEEFSLTIDYHINQLRKVPFGKINPKLFQQCHCNAGFYEFYHEWRRNRITYGFDSFKAHLLSLYDQLIKKYKIKEDYKIPFDKNDTIVEKYKEEIAKLKYDGNNVSHKIDAENVYLIEHKRGKNNINIKDTKYYLITTDQKLKQWDESHSQGQPLTLLPSHWMGLLIKYVSRTSDDFASFVSFLRLPHHDALLEGNEIQSIVSGISEITEDFKTQETVMQRMIETKFGNIIGGQKDSATVTNRARQFAKDVVEDEYKKELLKKDSERVDLESGHKAVLESKQYEFEQKLKDNDLKNKQDKLEEIKRQLESINRRKVNAAPKIKKKIDNEKIIWAIIIIFVFIGLLWVAIKYWDILEPIIFIFGFAANFVIPYLFFAIKGGSWDFRKYFDTREEKIKNNIYSEYDINIPDLNELEELKLSLEKELQNSL